MGTQYSHLNLEERCKVAKWREAKMPISEITDRLSRDASTIYRDLRRNNYDDKELSELNGCYALNAQDMYERRRSVHRTMVVHPDLKAAIEDRLKAGWSSDFLCWPVVSWPRNTPWRGCCRLGRTVGRSVALNDIFFATDHGGMGAVTRIQLFANRSHMHLHHDFGSIYIARDFLVGQAIRR